MRISLHLFSWELPAAFCIYILSVLLLLQCALLYKKMLPADEGFRLFMLLLGEIKTWVPYSDLHCFFKKWIWELLSRKQHLTLFSPLVSLRRVSKVRNDCVFRLLLPVDTSFVCKGPHVTLKARPWGIKKKMFLGAVQQGGAQGTKSVGRTTSREKLSLWYDLLLAAG